MGSPSPTKPPGPCGPPHHPQPATGQCGSARRHEPGERTGTNSPDRNGTDTGGGELTVLPPEQPPQLTPGAARALLRLLRRAADHDGPTA
jgi:hypothetical protein